MASISLSLSDLFLSSTGEVDSHHPRAVSFVLHISQGSHYVQLVLRFSQNEPIYFNSINAIEHNWIRGLSAVERQLPNCLQPLQCGDILQLKLLQIHLLHQFGKLECWAGRVGPSLSVLLDELTSFWVG